MGRYLAVGTLAIGALWWLTVAALYLPEAFAPWRFDGDCFEPRPVWGISQAVLAVAGVGFTTRSIHIVIAGRPELPVPILAAVVLFGVWLVVFEALDPPQVQVLCPGQSPDHHVR